MSKSRRKTISHLDLAEFLSGIEETKSSVSSEDNQFHESISEPITNSSSACVKSKQNSNRQIAKEIQLVRDYCKIKCRSKVTEVRQWEEVRKISLSLQDITSYNLIAARFIHPQKHYHPIGSVDNKRAILTGLSGMLADADVHRKADIVSTERFTRCKSVKSKNAYQYIDLESEEAIAFEEYENRYAQYVLSNKPPAPVALTTSLPPSSSNVHKRMEEAEAIELPFDDKENVKNESIANQPIPDIHKPKKRKHSQQSTDKKDKSSQQRRQTLSPSTAQRLLIEEAELQMAEQQALITLDPIPPSAEEPFDLLDEEISDFLMDNTALSMAEEETFKKQNKHKKGGDRSSSSLNRRSTLSPSAARAVAMDLLDTEEVLISLDIAPKLPVENDDDMSFKDFMFAPSPEANAEDNEEEEPLCAQSAEDYNIAQDAEPSLALEYNSADNSNENSRDGVMDDDEDEGATKALGGHELDLVLSDVNDEIQVYQDFDANIQIAADDVDEEVEEIAIASAAADKEEHSPHLAKKHPLEHVPSPLPVQPEFDGFEEVKTSSPIMLTTPNSQRWATERSFTPVKLVESSPTTAFFGRKSEGDILQQGLNILEKASSEIEGFEMLESFVANSLAPLGPSVVPVPPVEETKQREVSFLERFSTELAASSSSFNKELVGTEGSSERIEVERPTQLPLEQVVNEEIVHNSAVDLQSTAGSTALDESGDYYGADIDEMAWEAAAQRRMRERFARARWQYLWEVVSAQAANKAITHARKRQKTTL